MEKKEFDILSKDYDKIHRQNISISGENPEFFAKYKVAEIHRVLFHKDAIKKGMTILDFGCGIGNSLPFFQEFFPEAKLICIDVSYKSMKMAKKRSTLNTTFMLFDGEKIPIAEGVIDVAFAGCVFHHISKKKYIPLIKQLNFLLKETGYLFVFEHNPFNPLTLKAVKTCALDKNAKLINGLSMKKNLKKAGFPTTKLNYCLFFPKFLSILRKYETYLSKVPFGAQYYILGKKSGI
jgi:ubiquinone/menaquinone biosynthesis C-methylase UbiE